MSTAAVSFRFSIDAKGAVRSCDDAIVMLGHDEATCHECQSAREREEAMLREEQTLDVQTSGLDK
jgi:hypothetical protein